MTEQQAAADLLRIIQSGWPQIVAIGALIAWLATVRFQIRELGQRQDRHETRITNAETVGQRQDVKLARIEESLSGIKMTLDRTYTQVSELSRIQHHTDRTSPPR